MFCGGVDVGCSFWMGSKTGSKVEKDLSGRNEACGSAPYVGMSGSDGGKQRPKAPQKLAAAQLEKPQMQAWGQRNASFAVKKQQLLLFASHLAPLRGGSCGMMLCSMQPASFWGDTGKNQ